MPSVHYQSHQPVRAIQIYESAFLLQDKDPTNDIAERGIESLLLAEHVTRCGSEQEESAPQMHIPLHQVNPKPSSLNRLHDILPAVEVR